jgi:uncharacterized protein
MSELRFTWDAAKVRDNAKKHGVSFEEARSAFYDESALEFYDDEHAEWEDRFLLLGLSARLQLLLVCHCYREQDETIRIISARKATKLEFQHYGRHGDES